MTGPKTINRPPSVPVETPPVLDGEVLNDVAYASAEPATGFWQTTPDEGQPASQKTEVRVVYTPQTLYIGAVCYDTEPDKIIVADSRRDSDLSDTDSFQFILDTYGDKLNGFVFGTNPAGIEYDAQVTDEGRGSFGRGRQRGGAGGGFNLNWDGSWEVKARISDRGWSAEFAIPFRTLRFGKQEEQIWGVNFQRNIRRRNERAFWARLPRQYNLYRVSRAGRLVGLKGIRQRNLKFMPYALGSAVRDFDNEPATGTERDLDFGFDAKYGVTPGLTLDLTYNTDFAQVEVDEQQINFNRFNLFFPEKRPFFLENAGFFAVGSSGSVEMFFSRRIGIDEDGEAVSIVGGARLSGKLAGLNIGLLDMQTESVGAKGVPGNNFLVARAQKELPNRSAVGVLFVNRQGTGSLAPDNDYNRTLAVDGQLGIGEYGLLRGYGARTFTPGSPGDEYAFNFAASYNSEAWLLSATYTQVNEDFNPEVGFLQRKGFRSPEFLIFHRYRPKNFLGLLELRPHTSYRGFWRFDGFQETGFWHIDNHWEWRSGHQIHTGINFTREGIAADRVEVAPGVTELDSTFIQGVFIPPGTYDHVEAQLVAFTNQGAWWSVGFRGFIGGYFGGDRVSLSQSLRFRIGETFNTEVTYNRTEANLPEGDFTTNLVRARFSYSFTPSVMLQALIQYNDSSDIWSTNVRFSWLRTASTGLYIVYNDVQDVENARFSSNNRSLIVKYSHQFDLLN